MNILEKYALTFWFLCIFVITLCYCIKNWCFVTILKPLTGDSVMFYFLLGLSILPFISSFKIFDFEGKINNPLCPTQKMAEQNLDDIAHKSSVENNVNLNIQVSQKEYKNQIEKILNEKKGLK